MNILLLALCVVLWLHIKSLYQDIGRLKYEIGFLKRRVELLEPRERNKKEQ